MAAPGLTSVDVLAPLSRNAYDVARPSLLKRNSDREGTASRKQFESTVPPSLAEALAVETSLIQDAKWSQPPAGRLVSYARPEVGPRPPAGVPRRAASTQRGNPTVARLILAGRPRPPMTEAVKIGEVFRRALMASYAKRCGEPIPSELTGRDESNQPLRDPEHTHAFFLPEDDDEDGFIDHLVLFARHGLDSNVRRALDGLRCLWIADRPRRDEWEGSDAADGRREWRLALEGCGTPKDFADSTLLRPSRHWTSVTPYLRPRHLKGGSVEEETRAMVRQECARRGWPEPEVRFDVKPESDARPERPGRDIHIGKGMWRNALAFHRFRSRRGLVQPDCTGTALRLHFPEVVKPPSGPIALGFASHFGLGLFRAVESA